MAYAELMSSRSSFTDFGSLLSSVKQNAQDVLAQDTTEDDQYKAYKAQLEQTGLFEGVPGAVLFGENAYKAGKSIYTGINRARDALPKIQELGKSIKKTAGDIYDIGERGVENAGTVLKGAGGQVEDYANKIVPGIGDMVRSKLGLPTSNSTPPQTDLVGDEGERLPVVSTADAEQAGFLKAPSANVADYRSDLLSRYPKRTDTINSMSDEEIIAKYQGKVNKIAKQATQSAVEQSQQEDASAIESARANPVAEVAGVKPIQEAGQIAEVPKTNIQKLTEELRDLKMSPDDRQELMRQVYNERRTGVGSEWRNKPTVSEQPAPLEPITKVSNAKYVEGGAVERPVASSQLGTGGSELSEEGGDVLKVYSEVTKNVNPRGVLSSFSDRVGNYFNKGVASVGEEVKRIPGFQNLSGGTTLPVNPSVKAAVKPVAEEGIEMKSFAALNPEAQAEASAVSSQVVSQTAERAVAAAPKAVEAVSSAATNVGSKAENAVATVSKAVEGGETVATNAAAKATSAATSATEEATTTGKSILSNITGGLSEVAESTAIDVGEKVGLLATEAIPVVGEVVAAGLGIYQGIKGFEDLFSKPKAPTIQAVPQVANIAQSFQSGI